MGREKRKRDIDDLWVMWKRENAKVLEREVSSRRKWKTRGYVDVYPVEEVGPSKEELLESIRDLREDVVMRDRKIQEEKVKRR